MNGQKIRAVLGRELSPEEEADLASFVRAQSPSISQVQVVRVRGLAMSEADIVISIVIALSANVATDLMGELGLSRAVTGYLKRIGALKKSKPPADDEKPD